MPEVDLLLLVISRLSVLGGTTVTISVSQPGQLLDMIPSIEQSRAVG